LGTVVTADYGGLLSSTQDVKGVYKCEKKTFFDSLPKLFDDPTLNILAWLLIGFGISMLLISMIPKQGY